MLAHLEFLTQNFFNKAIVQTQLFMPHRYLCFFCLFILFSCQKEEEKTPDKELEVKIEKIGQFASMVNECSGFCFDNNQLLTINDGGAGSQLYFVNPTNPALVSPKPIEAITNMDWEAINCTSTEIIIGDFGNNFGIRKDLTIYHLDKSTFKVNQTISFSYPNQSSFDNRFIHNFDCEAMILLNDSYYLFTKNRGNKNTNLYTAPISSGNFRLRDSVEVPALVTDAYYHEASEQVILLCNEFTIAGFKSFIQILTINEEAKLLSVAILPLEINEQLEAITLKEGNSFYIGSEGEQNFGRNLYVVEILNL